MTGDARRDFEDFYAKSKDGCLRALLVSTRDRAHAEDLLAESFARAWARWPAVARHPNPAAWVMRTALHANVSLWRRHGREQPVREMPEEAYYDVLPDLDGLALLATLPTRQREVVALRVFLDFTTGETADALGIAEGTVTAHLHRATTSLRARMDTAADPKSEPTVLETR